MKCKETIFVVYFPLSPHFNLLIIYIQNDKQCDIPRIGYR